MYKTFRLFSSFWGETRYLTFAEKREFGCLRAGCSRLYTELRERERERERE